MNNKIRTKLFCLFIAFLISIVLASILSFCLVQIFSRQPQEILNINIGLVIDNIVNNKSGMELFVLSVMAFLLFMLVSVFKAFDLDDYLSKTYSVTPDIKIPYPVGRNQTQQGSAWWLNKKSLYQKPFGVNTFDPNNEVIHNLLRFSEKQKEIEKIKIDRLEKINDLMEKKSISFAEADKEIPHSKLPDIQLTSEQKENLKSCIFKDGGICVGKKDRNIFYPVKTKLFGKIPFIIVKRRKVEDIFYIKEDMHSLTVRCDQVRKDQMFGIGKHSAILH